MDPAPATTCPPLPLTPGPGHCARRCARCGFTLIEVLATLVLVAIVLPVAMNGISLALGAAGHAKRSVEGVQLAESKLNELIVTNQWLTGSASGDFGSDWPDYRWSAQVIERDVSLMQIDVNVSWPSRGNERSVTISTLIYTGASQQ